MNRAERMIELARSARIELTPWQELVIRMIVDASPRPIMVLPKTSRRGYSSSLVIMDEMRFESES